MTYSFRKRSGIYSLVSGVRYREAWTRFAEEEYWMLPHLIGRGQVGIDIGSNVGMYAYRMSRLVGPTGRVVAVEPQHTIARNVARTCRLLRLHNLTVLNAACGAESGRVSVSIPVDAHGTYIDGHGHMTERGKGAYEVDVVPLDDIVSELQLGNVGLIKIDVEGAERLVLAGAIRTITESYPVLICEIQDAWSHRYGDQSSSTLTLLQGYGYQCHIVQSRKLVPVDEIREDAVNYVFLPQVR